MTSVRQEDRPAHRPLLSAGLVRRLGYGLGRLLRRTPDLTYKQYSELAFWRGELNNIVEWYEGRLAELWGQPPPAPAVKVSRYDPVTNAVMTWAQVNRHYYPDHLMVPTDYFANMRLLDVGCGPIPRVRVFDGSERYGLDPLVNMYRAAGFPSQYDDFSFVHGCAEAMPFEGGSFDAVISVNAIDHVDDFQAAAREIERVLKPGGIVRMEIHYHQPTVCEPCALDDDIVRSSFRALPLRKLAQRRYSDLDADGKATEILTVWSNRE